MIKFEFHGDTKVLRSLCIATFSLGLILPVFPSIIGLSVIRIVGVIISSFSSLDIFFTEEIIWGKDRSFFLIGILTGILIVLFPTLVMIISGLGLLSFASYKLFFTIKDKAYNKNELATLFLTFFMGVFFIFKGQDALATIVRILGIMLISAGAILFYKINEKKFF